MTKTAAQLDAEIRQFLQHGSGEVSRLITALNRYGARAAELLEAGWYFEEGGCFGMSLAIAHAVEAAGDTAQLAVRTIPGVHAIACIRGRGVDWQGTVSDLTGYLTMSRARFKKIAAEHGHDAAALHADQRWATETIRLALELAADEDTAS